MDSDLGIVQFFSNLVLSGRIKYQSFVKIWLLQPTQDVKLPQFPLRGNYCLKETTFAP